MSAESLYHGISGEATEQYISKVIRQLMDMKGSMKETAPIGIISMDNWEWPQGVALFALYQYYKETGKKDVLDYLLSWFDTYIERGGIPAKNVNTMCPMLTLSYLYEETGKPSYLHLCKEWADYAMHDMPRTGEGALQHIVTGETNEGQVWDDTLYMTVLFLTRMGVVLKEERYVQEGIAQFLVHLKYLTDPATGLFFHGWTFLERHHFAGALWARGNSWYTAGLVDYLDMADVGEGVRQHLISSLESQVMKLIELQADDGRWHTLLTDQDSYKETSATAGIAYGILKAVRQGYLGPEYAEAGWKAYTSVLEQIDDDGIVHGVSYGTGMGRDMQYYKDIPVCPMPYGQSMALLMLVEALKHTCR